MREERRREFAEPPVRDPAHAGSAYPVEPEALRETMARYFAANRAGPEADGAVRHRRAACQPGRRMAILSRRVQLLRPEYRDRTFVILGTSHYGEPEKFGLTRKNFATPFGEAVTDPRLVDRLEARGGGAVQMEDYCHSFEHTVEFQVVFLQHAAGPDVRILPILCGPFAHSLYEGGDPEDHDGVKRFLDAFGELNAPRRQPPVLGARRGHGAHGRAIRRPFQAAANQGVMNGVASRATSSASSASTADDAAGFWELVRRKPRRPEVVRLRTILHVPEGGARRAGRAAAL